ncbi:MAG: tyrosine-type recombinase/integrase [Oscillospiraceae bacterium]
MVQCVHVVLNKALEHAVEEKLILANPAKKCKIPKNTREEMNILPEALIGPYLSAAKEHGILAPMYLELTTGLRRGELLALRWEDLDVQNCTLSINKSVARQNGKLVISTPKTPNSIRTVLLPEDTVKLLVEEHEKHPANPYLFPSPRTGETWDPDGFRRLHDRIIKEIGAEHVRFHDMRHTFATLSLKSGVDVRTLSETLGHFSAGFTLSTYVHSTPGMKQSAADVIGNTIRNAI